MLKKFTSSQVKSSSSLRKCFYTLKKYIKKIYDIITNHIKIVKVY